MVAPRLPNRHRSRRLFKLREFPDPDVLTLICPHCQHGHTDELECLDSGRLVAMRCESQHCNKLFVFLIRECLACGEESVFTWTRTPTSETGAMLSCQHCGAPLDDAARQSESQSPNQRL